MPSIVPGRPAPELAVDTLDGDRWVLADQQPERFTMVVFYRGLHCPICRTLLRELDGLLGELAERGVGVIAVSGDEEGRARQSRDEWELSGLTLGYGLREGEMRDWSLFVSAAIKEGEPERFNEPGLFLVAPDGTLYYAALNSMPFGRPKLAEMLEALDFIAEKDYPGRGEVPEEALAG